MKFVLCLALALMVSAAGAQIAPPRTLEELKTEIQTRADRRAYPVALLEPADVREALGNLKSLDRDHWAAVWSAIGDRHTRDGKRSEANDRAAALKHHKLAMEYHFFARFPLENSPGKERSYRKGLAAFADYARLLDPPLETVRIPYEGKTITGYLRMPTEARPAPVILTVGGLDGRKENASLRNDAYLAHGVAYFAVDMPAPASHPPGSWSPAPSASSRVSSTTSPRARSSTRSALSSTAGPGADIGRRASPTRSANVCAAR